MTEVTEKKCVTCGRTKSIEQFRTVAPHLGGGHAKNCKACTMKKSAATRAARKADAAAPSGPADDAPPAGAPTHEVGYSLGFKVHFEKGDFYVSQEQDGTRVSIILSVAEVDALHAFRRRTVTEAA